MYAARHLAWGFLVLVAGASLAMAQEGHDPFGDASASAAKPQAEGDAATPVFFAEEHPQQKDKIRKVLRSRLQEGGMKFSNTALSKVVEFLRDKYEVEVQLDLKALDDLGLSPDDPITVNLRHTSLESALTMMLRQLDLTYVIVDETLLITSEEEALTRLVVAVYPVGDILTIKESYESSVQDSGDERKQPSVEDMDGLIDVIISTVASDTWVENGGPEAEIHPLQPGLLVVSQTRDVQEQIQQLLAALRRAKQHEFAVPHREGRGGGDVKFYNGPTLMSAPTPAADQPPKEGAAPQQEQGGGGMF